MDILLLNAFLYVLTLALVIAKVRRMNLYVLTWSAFTVVACMGVYAVKMKWHYLDDPDLGYKVSVVPYIMAYLTVFVITFPFLKMDETKVDFSVLEFRFVKQIAYFFSVVFFINAILSGISAYVVANTVGVGTAYLMSHEGESVTVFSSPIILLFIRFAKFFTPLVFPLYVIYFFKRIVDGNGPLWKNLAFASLAFLPNILSAIAGGSKGSLFFSAFSLLFFYVFFRPLVSKKIKRKLFIVMGIVGCILFGYVVYITASRHEAASGRESTALQQEATIVRYLGEPFPNLGGYFYGNVKKNTGGRRFFPEFFPDNPEKYYSGKGLDAKFAYWGQITGVPMPIFKTFWGDWYIEFGFLGSIIAILALLLFFWLLCLRKYYVISRMPLVYFYFMNIVIRGCFTGNGLEGSNKHKILFLLIVELLYLDHRVFAKKRISAGK